MISIKLAIEEGQRKIEPESGIRLSQPEELEE